MEFTYKEKEYGAFYFTNGLIEFFQDRIPESTQDYKSTEDFESNAHINGILLKDMWYDVKGAQFMQCRSREDK